jgi:hypothetical protein
MWTRRARLLLLATPLLLLAAALRFHALGQDVRLHQDEALFASFARRAAVQGDWLLTGALDKTPLAIYLQALSMMAFGVRPLPDGVLTLPVHQGEFAARLPAVFASMLVVAVIGRVAGYRVRGIRYQVPGIRYQVSATSHEPSAMSHQPSAISHEPSAIRHPPSAIRHEPSAISHEPSAMSHQLPAISHQLSAISHQLFALFLAATSPMLIAFSPTAFTDLPMLLGIVLALAMALRGKPAWAGMWLGVAFAAKQQAVLLLPLVVVVAAVASCRLPSTGYRLPVVGCRLAGKRIAWKARIRRGGYTDADALIRPYKDANIVLQRANRPTLTKRLASRWKRGVGSRRPETGNWQPAARSGKLATHSRQPATGNRQPATRTWHLPPHTSHLIPGTWKLLAAFALVVLVLLGWDALRNSPPSVLALAAANNAPERWPRPDELLPRLLTWWGYADTWTGWPFALVLLLIGGWLLLERRRVTVVEWLLAGYTLLYLLAHWLLPFNTYDRYLLPILPLVLVLMARAIAVALNTAENSTTEWQRTADIPNHESVLTPLSPPSAAMGEGLGVRALSLSEQTQKSQRVWETFTGRITGRKRPNPSLQAQTLGEASVTSVSALKVTKPSPPAPLPSPQTAGRGEPEYFRAWVCPQFIVTLWFMSFRPWVGTQFIVTLMLLLTLLPAAWNAAQLQIAVGGDRGQLTGIDHLATWLEAKPLGTILYDRWLGWGLEYYRGSWSDKRMVYYPTPGKLAAGAAAQPDPAPRYFPMPVEAPAADWLHALRERGFTVSLVYQSQRFVVYQLIPPERPPSKENGHED